MIPGDLYYADVPFIGRLGSKVRPVVVIQIPSSETIRVLASQSHQNLNLEFIHSIDFNALKYYRIRCAGLGGVSYFYGQNLRNLTPNRFKRMLGRIARDDFAIILKHIADLHK